MASRTAESTIKGFLYQFNKTLLTVLQADEDEAITVEGIIEDIDVSSPSKGTKAIQCKYHEAQDGFTDSLLYKPLLQMAESYSKNPSNNIHYTIYIHIPTETARTYPPSLETLEKALKTRNQALLKIVGRISSHLDRKAFLRQVTIEFGLSIDELEKQVKGELESQKICGGDVNTLLYPNAITKISKLSSLANLSERELSKRQLKKYLSSITTTAITKWTLALKNRGEILTQTRKQLSSYLSQNSRERYFYINKNDIEDFDEKIVVFISNYLQKYHSKPAHTKTPLFAVTGSFDSIKTIEHRLFTKGIKSNTGLIGDIFEIDEFFREPIKKVVSGKLEENEFSLRLLAVDSEQNAINHHKGDDLYLICAEVPDYIDSTDVNTYQVCTDNFEELEYVMSLRNSYE